MNSLVQYFTIAIGMSIVLSCEEHYTKVVTYDDNGAIDKVYFIDKDSTKQGGFTVYYPNGRISSTAKYTDGNLRDTIFYYTDDEKNEIKMKEKYSANGYVYYIDYYHNNKPSQEGTYYNENRNKTGIWKNYDEEGNLRLSKEYKIIDGEEYTNQLWVMSPNGDTLNEGASMRYKINKDRIHVLDSIGMLFQTNVSTFPEEDSAQVQVVLPQDYIQYNFNTDFSNRPKPIKGSSEHTGIDVVTIPSLKDHKNPPKSTIDPVDYNKTVLLYWKPRRVGKDTIRGFFEEYTTYKVIENDPDPNSKNPDREITQVLSKPMYFEFPIEVVRN